MENVEIFGALAATLSTASFMPQAFKVIKTGHTKDLSLWMYILLTTGVALWAVYGFMLNQWPIIIANVISFIPNFIILIMKIREK